MNKQNENEYNDKIKRKRTKKREIKARNEEVNNNIHKKIYITRESMHKKQKKLKNRYNNL